SSHAGRRPELLCLGYSLHGKPMLADQGGLRFNLSHSGDLAVCAVSRSRDVGIDIEQIRPIDNLGRMFQSISSPSERTVWQTLDGTRQVDAFFNCWTVKESCAKALGTGLSTSVQSIEALNTDATPRVVACGTRLWFVFKFTPTDGYAGALAVEQWSTRAILPHVVFHRA